MNAGQSSVRWLSSRHVISRDTVCSSCLDRLVYTTPSSRRHTSTTATAARDTLHNNFQSKVPPIQTSDVPKAFRLLCSPVLSRPPQLTRDLTSFEKAFYLYQKRLNERLALPFTRYFYFKKGTPQTLEFKRKVKARQTVARDIGQYNAYAEDGWNDEVQIGSKLGEPEDIIDKIIRDAEGKDIVDAEPQGDAATGGEAVTGNPAVGEGVLKRVGDLNVVRPAPRKTEADSANDQKSLSRAMDRTLYLLVKDEEGHWRFPQDRVYGRENLNQAAERILLQTGGPNMNTWVVGNHPVAHHAHGWQKPQYVTVQPNKLVSTSKVPFEQQEFGEKVFFMKARIMAGQADLSRNELGAQDFLWLTKEEIEEKVGKLYWLSIRNMMPAR